MATGGNDRYAYLAFRSVQWCGMHLPRTIGLAAADLYHHLQYARSDGERRVVAGNLGRVLGHPPDSALVQRATKECFRLYGRYWYETFALRTMPAEEVNRRFSVEGAEHIDLALAAGTGIVCALPHMGNWDAAGHWLALNGYRMTAVGMNIVPLSTGSVAETLVGLLAENHCITLVADRDLSGNGVEVEMFGAKRQLPPGPALLSLSTGAPLCVAAVFTTAQGWHCRINAPIVIDRTDSLRADVTTLTRLVAGQFERFIAAAPTDWHMFQPAWTDIAPPVAGAERTAMATVVSS